ncbi:hypothetical protein FGO68_gene15526 [Halteria grandinella]|uniref:Uncharacterized protein n=1 Tax=Halteria grandinella TaxID=5974 RepID=A0A8J8NW89_HALGN|nr:hypothetical protein FGO68_gene15526 [Halteria grandinella]
MYQKSHLLILPTSNGLSSCVVISSPIADPPGTRLLCMVSAMGTPPGPSFSSSYSSTMSVSSNCFLTLACASFISSTFLWYSLSSSSLNSRSFSSCSRRCLSVSIFLRSSKNFLSSSSILSSFFLCTSKSALDCEQVLSYTFSLTLATTRHRHQRYMSPPMKESTPSTEDRMITSGAHSVPLIGWTEPRFVRFRDSGVILYGLLSTVQFTINQFILLTITIHSLKWLTKTLLLWSLSLLDACPDFLLNSATILSQFSLLQSATSPPTDYNPALN